MIFTCKGCGVKATYKGFDFCKVCRELPFCEDCGTMLENHEFARCTDCDNKRSAPKGDTND